MERKSWQLSPEDQEAIRRLGDPTLIKNFHILLSAIHEADRVLFCRAVVDYIVLGRRTKFYQPYLEIQFDLLTKEIEYFLDPINYEN